MKLTTFFLKILLKLTEIFYTKEVKKELFDFFIKFFK